MAMAINTLPYKLSLPLKLCSELTNFNNEIKLSKTEKPSIIVSTNPSHININSLSQLYTSCNHSPYVFPSATSGVDTRKLAVAVAHSAVVVSVFARDEPGLLGRMRVLPGDGVLVGFGRAISDLSLTATLFDVMVIPCFRRMGFGRMIVQRVIRILANKGIYDISALCSEEQRPFFAACGFGDDLLGSTTMSYTKTAPLITTKLAN